MHWVEKVEKVEKLKEGVKLQENKSVLLLFKAINLFT